MAREFTRQELDQLVDAMFDPRGSLLCPAWPQWFVDLPREDKDAAMAALSGLSPQQISDIGEQLRDD